MGYSQPETRKPSLSPTDSCKDDPHPFAWKRQVLEGMVYMTTHTLDAKGMRCPQPILKITAMLPSIVTGDVLEVSADCSTFEADVNKWCERMNKTLLAVMRDGDVVTAQIQFQASTRLHRIPHTEIRGTPND